MLDLAAAPRERPGETPRVLAKLRGSLKRGSVSDYRKYVEQKYK